MLVIFQGPPDPQVINEIRTMCTRNINDDYCYVALEKVENDKSAPDFDVCMYDRNIIINYMAKRNTVKHKKLAGENFIGFIP